MQDNEPFIFSMYHLAYTPRMKPRSEGTVERTSVRVIDWTDIYLIGLKEVSLNQVLFYECLRKSSTDDNNKLYAKKGKYYEQIC